MIICVFDTETASLQKPFCYNIGYTIVDMDTEGAIQQVYVSKNFIVEQVWHNSMLFSTAYYADKRPIYVAEMRRRRAVLEKFGYITQEMVRDFKRYGVQYAYAFNSPFDDRVFEFNCDWFHCINPFDNIPVFDIRGFAHTFLVDDTYLEFCDKYAKYTDSGNYSTTAETVYQFITDNPDFQEEHTALEDSKIELEILQATVKAGARLDTEYPVKVSIPRRVLKEFQVVHKGTKAVLFSSQVYTARVSKTNGIKVTIE